MEKRADAVRDGRPERDAPRASPPKTSRIFERAVSQRYSAALDKLSVAPAATIVARAAHVAPSPIHLACNRQRRTAAQSGGEVEILNVRGALYASEPPEICIARAIELCAAVQRKRAAAPIHQRSRGSIERAGGRAALVIRWVVPGERLTAPLFAKLPLQSSVPA